MLAAGQGVNVRWSQNSDNPELETGGDGWESNPPVGRLCTAPQTVLKSEFAGVRHADEGRANLGGIRHVPMWGARIRASPTWMAHKWHMVGGWLTGWVARVGLIRLDCRMI